MEYVLLRNSIHMPEEERLRKRYSKVTAYPVLKRPLLGILMRAAFIGTDN